MKGHRKWIVSMGTFLLIMFTSQASAETYEEGVPPDLDGDVILLNNDFFDMEAFVPPINIDDPVKQLFYNQDARTPGRKDGHLAIRERYYWEPNDINSISLANNDIIKLPIMKRSADTNGLPVQTQARLTRPSNKEPKKPMNQRRNVGSQFICYLKVCNLLTNYNKELQ